jgi:hypothetical protein
LKTLNFCGKTSGRWNVINQKGIKVCIQDLVDTYKKKTC